MTAATLIGAAGGKRAYTVAATVTIDCGAGAVLERIICVASSSGTLALADSAGTITGTALSLAAKDVLELNIPVRGTLTVTKGGSSVEAILVFSP